MILKTEFYTIMDRAIAIKRDKYQRWPVHVVAQAGKVFHKSGELMKAASEYKYEKAEGLEQSKEQHEAMETLCLETIATCLRFLEKRKPFSHPDLPAVEPEPEPNPHQITMTLDQEIQDEIDYKSIFEPRTAVEKGADIYDGADVNPLVIDEVGRFTTEDVKAIDLFQSGNIKKVVGPGLKVVETGSEFIISTQDDPKAPGIWERQFPENPPSNGLELNNKKETPFPDVLDEITPEQLEQAALLLDEPDHTFTEKNPE
jgi:hypothetical protein